MQPSLLLLRCIAGCSSSPHQSTSHAPPSPPFSISFSHCLYFSHIKVKGRAKRSLVPAQGPGTPLGHEYGLRKGGRSPSSTPPLLLIPGVYKTQIAPISVCVKPVVIPFVTLASPFVPPPPHHPSTSSTAPSTTSSSSPSTLLRPPFMIPARSPTKGIDGVR